MMTEDTKLCPYCAKEIMSEASVCKHCVRALPGYKALKPENAHPTYDLTARIDHPSIWIGARRVGFVATILLILGVISRANVSGQGFNLRPEDFGTIINGGIAVFLIFTLIGGGIVWMKRKFRLNNSLIIVGISLLLFALLFITSGDSW